MTETYEYSVVALSMACVEFTLLTPLSTIRVTNLYQTLSDEMEIV